MTKTPGRIYPGVRILPAIASYCTVIVAAFESAVPHGLLTRTQYVSVLVSAGVVNWRPVAPSTGNCVLPVAPRYHWKLNGPVPMAETERVAVLPEEIVCDCGCDDAIDAMNGVLQVRLTRNDVDDFVSPDCAVTVIT
jgi:hypothetical protein